ncbi:DUF5361 domain-containing protein [Plantibacter sp. Mn2098]|uniref:DUF5361 domain-containing protein n=1 Tax=Plantibacter sp. Mn2098 TaxID=3395266 RepID=UPI003BE63670
MTELVAWLPPGCALWRSVGGPLAWSEETHQLNIIEFRLRVLDWRRTPDGEKGKNQPKPPVPPPYAGDVRAGDEHAEKQAAAHRRRQQHAT